MIAQPDSPSLLYELLSFLHDPSPQVRAIALRNILPFTVKEHPNRVVIDGLGGLDDDEKSGGGGGGGGEKKKKKKKEGRERERERGGKLGGGGGLKDLKDLKIKKNKEMEMKEVLIWDLKKLSREQNQLIAHDAFSALINLTDTGENQRLVALGSTSLYISQSQSQSKPKSKSESGSKSGGEGDGNGKVEDGVGEERGEYIAYLLEVINSKSALLSDLSCMLLSNLTKLESVSEMICNSTLDSIAFIINDNNENNNVNVEEKTDEDNKSNIERKSRSLDSTFTNNNNNNNTNPNAAKTTTTTRRKTPHQIPAIEELVEVFCIGEGKKWNKNAEFDFLASVFSNLSQIPKGRRSLIGLLSESTFSKISSSTPSPFSSNHRHQEPSPLPLNEETSPLAKLSIFLEHDRFGLIRRGGVASCIRNCCFGKEFHSWILEEDKLNILPRILLPLCGEEGFDLERSLSLPPLLLLLPSTQSREPDPKIRLIHLESLLLLASTFKGRQYLREKEVYEVLRVWHAWEKEDMVLNTIDRLVQLLMREEAPETKKDLEPTEITELTEATEMATIQDGIEKDKEKEVGERWNHPEGFLNQDRDGDGENKEGNEKEEEEEEDDEDMQIVEV